MVSTKKSNVVDFRINPRETQQQALDRLYSDHHVGLRRFLRARINVAHDIDDIVQEVFAKLAKIDRLSELLPANVDGNHSYIFRVANNLVINIERHKAIRKRYLDSERSQLFEEGGITKQNPEHISLVQQELDKIRDVIFRMRPNWRQAFILSRFKQKTYVEISNHMGVSVKQIEKYMQKALIVVRNGLKEIQEKKNG